MQTKYNDCDIICTMCLLNNGCDMILVQCEDQTMADIISVWYENKAKAVINLLCGIKNEQYL